MCLYFVVTWRGIGLITMIIDETVSKTILSWFSVDVNTQQKALSSDFTIAIRQLITFSSDRSFLFLITIAPLPYDQSLDMRRKICHRSIQILISTSCCGFRARVRLNMHECFRLILIRENRRETARDTVRSHGKREKDETCSIQWVSWRDRERFDWYTFWQIGPYLTSNEKLVWQRFLSNLIR